MKAALLQWKCYPALRFSAPACCLHCIAGCVSACSCRRYTVAARRVTNISLPDMDPYMQPEERAMYISRHVLLYVFCKDHSHRQELRIASATASWTLSSNSLFVQLVRVSWFGCRRRPDWRHRLLRINHKKAIAGHNHFAARWISICCLLRRPACVPGEYFRRQQPGCRTLP